MNLAVKAVLTAMTQLEHAEEDADDYDPPAQSATFLPRIMERDPISIMRTFITSVSNPCPAIKFLLMKPLHRCDGLPYFSMSSLSFNRDSALRNTSLFEM